MSALLQIAQQDVRLIPRPLWGYSLASLCVASSWGAIRDDAILGASGRCVFSQSPGKHDGTLEAHERWTYDLSGCVRLEAIWPLCRHCHELFHPGRVLARSGQRGLNQLTRRYASTAAIGQSEAKRRYDAAFRSHSLASKIPKWTINASLVAAHFPLKAKKAKLPGLEAHAWHPNPFAHGNSTITA